MDRDRADELMAAAKKWLDSSPEVDGVEEFSAWLTEAGNGRQRDGNAGAGF